MMDFWQVLMIGILGYLIIQLDNDRRKENKQTKQRLYELENRIAMQETEISLLKDERK